MFRIGIVVLCSVLVTACLSPFVLLLVRRLKVNQPILGYVENHYSKSGTPTMGGMAFLLGVCVVIILSNVGYSKVTLVATVSTLGFGILGFLDDFIKVKYKQNLGLRPYQKIIGQVGISLILAMYVYYFSGRGGQLVLPFSLKVVDIGFWVVPLIVVLCLALTNAVNLTDGLDGLASNTSMQYFSQRYLTTTGGRYLVFGKTLCALRNASSVFSHRRKVSPLTPAARASSVLV